MSAWAKLKQLPFALALGLILSIVSWACEAKAPPPAPPKAADSGSGSSTSSGSGSASGSSGSNSADDEEDEEEEDEEEDEEEPSDSGFKYGGAEIGDEETKEAAKTCIDSGKFFDREGDDGAGKCTSMALAKVECTIPNLKKVLTGDNLAKFEAALAGSYADLSFDQCVDCPSGGSAKICQNKAGEYKSGTTFTWASYEDDVLTIKTMSYSKRFQ